MKFNKAQKICITAFLFSLSAPLLAHSGFSPNHSFWDGFSHPWLGIDHLLAMVAVGYWSYSMGGNKVWMMPLSFLLTMTDGAYLQFIGVIIPNMELLVLVSIPVVLGGYLLSNNRPISTAISLSIISVFAFCHGYVHAVEMEANEDKLEYVIGFLSATTILLVIGLVSCHRIQSVIAIKREITI